MTTATDTYDPYALSSGLADDFDGTIVDAYFGTDAQYNDGQTILLIMDVATDDPDWPKITEKLSTGTGWEIVDGGARIQSENGKPRNYNKQSRVALFLSAIAGIGGIDTLRAKGTPFEAATFKGLSFHWLRQKIKGFDGTEKEVLLPSALVDGGVAAPAATNGSVPAASTSSEVVSPALTAKLKAAAKAASDHSDFIDKAFAIDGVTGNGGAEAMVVDEATYLALKEG